MNTKYMLLVSLAASLALSSCSKEQDVTEESTPVATIVRTEEPTFTCPHDAGLNMLAKAVSQAVRNNPGMRQFIHSESLLCFDGDYDFLISKAMDKPVSVSNGEVRTRSGLTEMTFGEMVGMYLPKTKSGEDLLASLQEQYPDLQVAVPIHAGAWDPESYTPVVVFLPEDYKEFETETLPGYDAEGQYVEVDAIQAPNVPVIVLSHNERMSLLEGTEEEVDQHPAVPQNLSAVCAQESILLTWTHPGAMVYFIWRKALGETQFQQIGISSGSANQSFEDTAIAAETYYQYYVIAANYELTSNGLVYYYSGPSAIVTAQSPARLSALTSFGVAPSGTSLRFSWTGGDASSDLVIEEKGPSSSGYSEIYRAATWNSYWYKVPSNRGLRHEYIAYRSNALSQSDTKEAVIYPPFRNTNYTSHTYARKLNIGHNMDGWAQGAPEFYMKVLGLDPAGNAAVINTVWMYFSGGYKDKEESFTNKDIYSWVYGALKNEWLSRIDLALYESDAT